VGPATAAAAAAAFTGAGWAGVGAAAAGAGAGAGTGAGLGFLACRVLPPFLEEKIPLILLEIRRAGVTINLFTTFCTV